MPDEDKNDIIKKVENSGKNDEESPEPEVNQEPSASNVDSNPAETPGSATSSQTGEAPMNEMALNDHNVQELITIYDKGDISVKKILSRLVSFSDNINREEFLHDLQDEIDYNDLKEIFEELRKAGVNTGPSLHEESLFLEEPKRNNMFQPGSNNILKNELKVQESFSNFDNKTKIKLILQESLKQDIMTTQPITKPEVKPNTPIKKPSRRDKPFKPAVTPGVRPDPKALKEASNDFEVYHSTFSSAVQTARAWAEKRGFIVTDDDWFTKINTGPKKPSEGDTNRYSLELIKDGKLSKKMLHIQVYNMGPKYELNAYIQ